MLYKDTSAQTRLAIERGIVPIKISLDRLLEYEIISSEDYTKLIGNLDFILQQIGVTNCNDEKRLPSHNVAEPATVKNGSENMPYQEA